MNEGESELRARFMAEAQARTLTPALYRYFDEKLGEAESTLEEVRAIQRAYADFSPDFSHPIYVPGSLSWHQAYSARFGDSA